MKTVHLENYFVHPIKFEEHVKHLYPWDENLYETFRDDLLENEAYVNIQKQIPFDVAIYPFVLELCSSEKRMHFNIFMKRHGFLLSEMWENMYNFLCAIYLVQYFFV
jgi:hypothetical protein